MAGPSSNSGFEYQVDPNDPQIGYNGPAAPAGPGVRPNGETSTWTEDDWKRYDEFQRNPNPVIQPTWQGKAVSTGAYKPRGRPQAKPMPRQPSPNRVARGPDGRPLPPAQPASGGITSLNPPPPGSTTAPPPWESPSGIPPALQAEIDRIRGFLGPQWNPDEEWMRTVGAAFQQNNSGAGTGDAIAQSTQANASPPVQPATTQPVQPTAGNSTLTLEQFNQQPLNMQLAGFLSGNAPEGASLPAKGGGQAGQGGQGGKGSQQQQQPQTGWGTNYRSPFAGGYQQPSAWADNQGQGQGKGGQTAQPNNWGMENSQNQMGGMGGNGLTQPTQNGYGAKGGQSQQPQYGSSGKGGQSQQRSGKGG